MYIPEKNVNYYRIGFYDNILDTKNFANLKVGLMQFSLFNIKSKNIMDNLHFNLCCRVSVIYLEC